jgi:RNA polymerase sigma-70 factor, ECF subfamily
MVTQIDRYNTLTTLLCAGKNGDQVAYAQFLSAITPMLRRAIGRKIPSMDVEDVLQEVLISIHKARHTYDSTRPIMPWVAAISNFRITDYLRKHYAQMRHQTCDIADYENILTDVTEDTYDNESIDELMEHVPAREQKILTLMHIEGYTAKEVGKQMDMNESAVKVAAHRAIKKIREKFAL